MLLRPSSLRPSAELLLDCIFLLSSHDCYQPAGRNIAQRYSRNQSSCGSSCSKSGHGHGPHGNDAYSSAGVDYGKWGRNLTLERHQVLQLEYAIQPCWPSHLVLSFRRERSTTTSRTLPSSLGSLTRGKRFWQSPLSSQAWQSSSRNALLFRMPRRYHFWSGIHHLSLRSLKYWSTI